MGGRRWVVLPYKRGHMTVEPCLAEESEVTRRREINVWEPGDGWGVKDSPEGGFEIWFCALLALWPRRNT